LIKHDAIKTYWGSGGTVPSILNLSTRLSLVVIFTPREKTRRIGGWVNPTAGLDAVAKIKKSLLLPVASP